MKRTSFWFALAALSLSACSGGSDGGAPPTPPQQAVASVEVTPPSGAITLPGTLQLSAVARDAQGAALSGRSIAWSSSATNVATVSGSGLVTSVAVGTVSISATAEGKTGQASITVSSAVASVEVTPPMAIVNLPGTVQLTATPKDAQGAAVTGRTIVWTSGTTSVATVSSAGLVTAIASGTSVVTAATDGKQGQATVTVMASSYGPVVASADIGPAGGTVSSVDIGVTIPAGAFTSTNTITLARDTVQASNYPGNTVSATYALDGIPAGQVVQTRVRVKYTGTSSGVPAIAVNRPAMQYGSDVKVVMGTTLVAATDSSGYLVATIPIAGKPASWTDPTMSVKLPAIASFRFPRAYEVDPRELKAAVELSGLMNMKHSVSASGHFDVWGFGNAADLQAKIEKTGRVVEQGLTTITDMGYSVAHRTDWPIEVYVMPISDAYGYWTVVLPFPVDPNKGYIAYAQQFIDDSDFPGTAIHEIFHMTQTQYTLGKDWPLVAPTRWINEATSTWMMEMHPLSPKPYTSPIALSWRDSLFGGLTGVMVANSGYGKAPMIKYIQKRWGNAKIKEIYGLIQTGAAPVSAMLMALPEQPVVWWPDALNQHMAGTLYPWNTQDLVPRHQYRVDAWAGDLSFRTDFLAVLGVQAQFIYRDTAKFGPNFQLPVYIDNADIGRAKIVAYRKTAASAVFTPLGVGDTVKIPGTVLQRLDSVLFLVTPTAPVAPYNTVRKIGFHVDLKLPDGDWRFPTVTNVVDGNHFVCDKPGNTVTMDVAANASGVWDFMSQMGTWKLSVTNADGTTEYEWAVDPLYADTLAKYRMSLQSTLEQRKKDTVQVTGNLTLNWGAAGGGGAGDASSNSLVALGWWWLLVPLSAVPFALRKRLRRFVPVATIGTASALILVSCGIGQIAMNMDEDFDYTFTKVRFMTDPAKPADPLMTLTDGKGESLLNSYRSEYWSYTTDATGTTTDSSKVTCTGSGRSTYTVSGIAYADGVKPPTASSVDMVTLIARAVGRNPAVIKQNMRSLRR